MPRTIVIENRYQGRVKTQVATEKELLEFANAVRTAGGAEVIEALFPSQQANAKACLIATALNFGCTIDTCGRTYPDGSPRWAMEFPESMDDARIGAIIDQVPGARRSRILDDGGRRILVMRLPKHIGNAAWAFDEGAAFQNYVKGE